MDGKSLPPDVLDVPYGDGYVAAAVEGGDQGTLTGKCQSGRLADAAGTASDECDFA